MKHPIKLACFFVLYLGYILWIYEFYVVAPFDYFDWSFMIGGVLFYPQFLLHNVILYDWFPYLSPKAVGVSIALPAIITYLESVLIDIILARTTTHD